MSNIIIPGDRLRGVPEIVPYCGFCELPVEKYVIEWPKSPYRISVDAYCCGHHQGRHVSLEEVMRIKKEPNSKLWCVVRTGKFQAVNPLKRSRVA